MGPYYPYCDIVGLACLVILIVLTTVSVYLLDNIRNRVVYDQDLPGPILPRNLYHTQISNHRVYLPRVLGHQQLGDLLRHHLRLQPNTLILEPGHQG